jgi:leader peptidase (prepilin peptidase)/N-methyltransferase
VSTADAVVIIMAALFGVTIGSFLNVVLWRVPRRESIVSPPSHCPVCGTPLAARDLVPVVSWVALRGRCRTCNTAISVRYPLVEFGCGALFALVAWLIVH